MGLDQKGDEKQFATTKASSRQAKPGISQFP
jgi:hypothetical protein